MATARKILIITSDRNLREVLKFCFDGWGYEVVVPLAAVRDIAPIKKIAPDVIVVDVHSAKRTDLEICRLLKDDFLTAYIPVITLINKRQLRSQLLSIKQGIDDYLIKPPDPLDLRVRIEMALKRAQHSLFSTPLTGLPGGRLIEDTLGGRLAGGGPFSFGYLDLDNFKYFNDTYGYVKGDRVIMQTAYMLYTTISKAGNRGDFIGHIGGDDFAFITTPDKQNAMCQYFISQFNRIMPFHYTRDDRANGYIVARDRTHTIKKIPLMSVSIAVVNRTQQVDFKNIIEINEKVAEVKRYLKGFTGSKFMADRRSGDVDGRQSAQIYRIETGAKDLYRPLGQILLERDDIDAQKLDEALTVHWRRGVRLGEILTELGFVREARVAGALNEARKAAGAERDGAGKE